VARLRLRSGFLGVQVGALVLHAQPQALFGGVVERPVFAVHRSANTGAAQPVGPEDGRELADLDSLLSVNRRYEPVNWHARLTPILE